MNCEITWLIRWRERRLASLARSVALTLCRWTKGFAPPGRVQAEPTRLVSLCICGQGRPAREHRDLDGVVAL